MKWMRPPSGETSYCVPQCPNPMGGIASSTGNPNASEPSPVRRTDTLRRRPRGSTKKSSAPSRRHTAELGMRGWTCFQPPVPNRIVCSRPHQGRPEVGNPPPDDRPANFTFLVVDGSGVFMGTELLIRTDLYKGQLC